MSEAELSRAAHLAVLSSDWIEHRLASESGKAALSRPRRIGGLCLRVRWSAEVYVLQFREPWYAGGVRGGGSVLWREVAVLSLVSTVYLLVLGGGGWRNRRANPAWIVVVALAGVGNFARPSLPGPATTV